MDVLIAASTDWLHTFYPATVALLNGEPFRIYNAPWSLFPLIPFAAFPYGRELMLLAAIFAVTFTAYRLGAHPLGIVALCLVPFALDIFFWGNVEWLAILGFVINPALGLILLAIKPQMTIAVMAYIAIETWRNHGWKQTALTLAPLAVLTLASFVVFGLWPLATLTYMDNRGSFMDVSLFPYSVPVGLVLFVRALRVHNIRYAIAASPMFFPVLTPQCWFVVFLALVSSTPRITLASVGIWAYGLLR